MRKKDRKRGGDGEGAIQAIKKPQNTAGIGRSPEISSLCNKRLSQIFMVLLREVRVVGLEFQVGIEEMNSGGDHCSGDFRIPSLLVSLPNCLNNLPSVAHWDFQSPVTTFPYLTDPSIAKQDATSF